MAHRDPFEHRSKAERVADAVQQEIAAQHLPEGASLGTKAQLRARLGARAATLNTALQILVDRGVVTVRPGIGGGVRVAAQSPPGVLRMARGDWAVHGPREMQRRVKEAVGVDLVLMPVVVAEAAHRHTDDDRTAITEALQRFRDSVTDPSAYRRAHNHFHRTLIDATHNEVLITVMNGLVSLAEQDVAGLLPPDAPEEPGYFAERAAVHAGIADAVLARDVPEAWRRLLDHGFTLEERDGGSASTGLAAVLEQWRIGVTARVAG